MIMDGPRADGLPISHGMIRLPDIPGIGIELTQNLFEVFRDL
jgi:L-alanine-DL-glutamate epimerase-like enolase superfamily enzyme